MRFVVDEWIFTAKLFPINIKFLIKLILISILFPKL